ncbi:aspartyl/asparaginyl beta-hydroxylase domain-containing protein [Pseudomonas fakonensis]|uniref:Aspartyl/asparaginyl beta-hydroxylase domain-containing protein n=1 Tax=Pseudomonas fakonensis TaxID=2842355 RepID=A0ABX8N9W7_9PSED|nr:aspartyl/asparaginyl beta-hydroxylase domain-containing protein [Pseudomonas fakonensis]QXH53062.1 aspartyl/asparaginyl beta-hydroxylase domain-containing protein [Pseudomonas fakonensis]
MNTGAFLIKKDFFIEDEIKEIASLAVSIEQEKTNVHGEGKYKDIQWHKVDLTPEAHPFVARIYEFLGAEKNGICVFYYLSPGAVLHPHRDLTGASSNARLRFHVPIITHDNIFFNVSRERVVMSPGELWALDTSFLHEVRNEGDSTRVHIVIECQVNEAVKRHLPVKNLSGRLHDVYFVLILGLSFMKSLLVNIWKDPKYFWAQMQMLKKFVGWRVFGKKDVK